MQDRKNADLLFAGTEMGVFATLDAGQAWFPFGTGLPPYALVHDLLIHPRENDLVVATHGRGLFAVDVTPVQEATAKLWDEDAHLFAVEPKIQWPRLSMGSGIGTGGDRQFVAPNEPAGLVINYLLKTPAAAKVKVRITDAFGEEYASLEGSGDAGFQSVVWDFRRTTPAPGGGAAAPASATPAPLQMRGPRLSPPGDYVVTLEIGEKKLSKRALIRAAPGL